MARLRRHGAAHRRPTQQQNSSLPRTGAAIHTIEWWCAGSSSSGATVLMRLKMYSAGRETVGGVPGGASRDT